ncbi:unnamed protein product [Choristocarpus tenellus]
MDTSDPSLAYNAACAMSFAGNEIGASVALQKYARRFVASLPAQGVEHGTNQGREEGVRLAIADLRKDPDLEFVRGSPWFEELLSKMTSLIT